MKIALIYDFDGTLSPGNMQEYNFIPDVGYKAEDFWRRSTEIAQKYDADPILTYLYEIISNAKRAEISLRRESFQRYGRSVQFFEGVLGWFERINAYGKEQGVEIEHYINSSGIKEMIEGTPIAEYFKKIYACSFLYDVDGVAYWPAVSVNYTNKTQFIFKINKGIEEVYEDKRINEFIAERERPMPFERMIYIGDGTTDIPCMRLVKEKRGHSIAVYDPAQKDRLLPKMQQLIDDDRVNFYAPADYSDGSRMDTIVRSVIDKIIADDKLNNL